MGYNVLQQIDHLLAKPGLSKKVAFFRLLAITSNAGLGTRDALKVIYLGEVNKGMREVIATMLVVINKGGTLSSAMEVVPDFFAQQEVALIRSAEAIGNLPDVLLGVAEELEASQKLIAKVQSAMIYPSVIIVFSIIAVIVLLIKVIPTIVGIFPDGTSIPFVTQVMLNVSGYLQSQWFVLAAGISGVVFGVPLLYKYMLPFRKIVDGAAIYLPMIGSVVMNMNLYRFSKLMSDFSNAGVSLVDSVNIISDTMANYRYRKRVQQMADDLFVGLSMVDSVEGSKLFPPVLTQIIDIGEKTGNLGDVLKKMANFYKESVETSLEGLTKLIEPLLMGFIAIVIGTIVASVFLPMAEIINVVSA